MVQPGTRSAVGSIADSVPAFFRGEDALVTGALQMGDDSISFHTISRGRNESVSQTSMSRRPSLDALELAPSLAYVAFPENEDAISTALPDSNEESRYGSINSHSLDDHHSQFEGASLHESRVSADKSYASRIETLSLHLPHLNNIRKSSRREEVSVTCYDYSDDMLASVKALFTVIRPSNELQNAEGVSLRRYLGDVLSDNVQFRLIVANDLSTDLIDCLGTSFSISPEVFEEHLVNSGWQSGTYNDEEPDTWITREMGKSHTSIRWFRPVKRILQRPYSTEDRQRLLDASAKPFSWSEAVPNKFGATYDVTHLTGPATNILRQDWDLRADTEATFSAGGFAAWEERATVWSKQCGSCRVAVLLLDPLPIVKDQMTGPVEALRRLVNITETDTESEANSDTPPRTNSPRSYATDQSSRGLTNCFSLTKFRPRAALISSLSSLGRWIFAKIPRPQDFSGDDGPCIEEQKTSQAAEDPESGRTGRERQQRIPDIGHTGARNEVSKLLGRLLGQSTKKPETVDRGNEPGISEKGEETEIQVLKSMNRCIFEGLYPRGPAVDYDFLMNPDNTVLLAEHVDLTKPTAANLAEWLTYNHGRQSPMVGSFTHLEYLFAIIHNDTMNTLRHMDLALREIGQHILDETLIQQRLVHWRLLLERFGTEFQQLEDSLRRFAGFINASKVSDKNSTEDQNTLRPPVEKLLEDSVSQINSLRQRTTRSHKSLMANMSIIESKRGIAEAESVTKLTELAFFFIPLTFSASVFSMQVKELNASRTSIAAFFILAVIITTALYALRLLIRSEKFTDLKKRSLNDIRHNAGLASGSSIPTKIFLAWLWQRNRWFIIGLGITGVSAGPIAALWTSQLTTGIKVDITIVITTLYVGAVIVVALYAFRKSLTVSKDILPWARYYHNQEV